MRAATVRIHWGDGAGKNRVADPASILRAVLSVDDAALNYCAAKLAFDDIVKGDNGSTGVKAQLSTLVARVRQIAGTNASPDARVAALRQLLYVAGPWNGGEPFSYDHDDPLGQSVSNKVISQYLKSKRGNCVSMPALFAILAESIGVHVAFATAPLHVFVRYRTESGPVVNIETTSGGHACRDEWYREQMPMSDRAVENGLYLRSLSKREGIALLATTVLERLMEEQRYSEALKVSDVILEHAPLDAYTMVKQATICGEIFRGRFTENNDLRVPVGSSDHAWHSDLIDRNHILFGKADSLGWQP